MTDGGVFSEFTQKIQRLSPNAIKLIHFLKKNLTNIAVLVCDKKCCIHLGLTFFNEIAVIIYTQQFVIIDWR